MGYFEPDSSVDALIGKARVHVASIRQKQARAIEKMGIEPDVVMQGLATKYFQKNWKNQIDVLYI